MKHTLTLLTALLLTPFNAMAPFTAIHAADSPKLEPILSKRGDVIFSDGFDGPMKPGGGGTVNYDDVQIWKAEPNPQWEVTRAKLMPSSKK